MFLMDTGSNMFIYVGSNTNPSTIKNVFGEYFYLFRAVALDDELLPEILLIFYFLSTRLESQNRQKLGE